MNKFFEITRDYFNKNLMEECVITHIFNYYYIQIRDVSWPRCIHFEWYPLGISKLTKNVSLSFCFHIECSEEKRSDLSDRLWPCFQEKCFKQEKNSRTISFSKEVSNSTGKSIMEMIDDDSLKAFLENVYSVIDKDLISNINEAIDTVWKDVSKE